MTAAIAKILTMTRLPSERERGVERLAASSRIESRACHSTMRATPPMSGALSIALTELGQAACGKQAPRPDIGLMRLNLGPRKGRTTSR